MQLIVSYLIIIAIILTAIQGNYGLVVAQQLDGDVGNTGDISNDNLSQIQTKPISDENQTESFFNSENQSVMLPEPIRDNIDQSVSEPTGNNESAGPPGPAGNNSSILKENLYIKNGFQQSTSGENSFVTATATCNDNDIPLSGAYSIVGNQEGDDNGEINEIGSYPTFKMIAGR